MKYVFGIVTFVLAMTLCIDLASAQSRKGFEVGFGPSLLVATGDGDSDTGFGAHLTLAYGIGERFTIGLNGAAGAISDNEEDDGSIIASVGGIFGRLYFSAPENRTRPYVTFGGGEGSLEGTYGGTKIEVTGPSGMLGVGLDHMRPGSRLGFYGELNYNVVNFEEVSVGGITLDGFNEDLNYIVFAAGLRFRIQ